MLRDPSIHMCRSDLIRILEKERVIQRILDREFLFAQDIVSVLLTHYKDNIKDRIILTALAKTRKKLERTVLAEENIVEDFNKVYNAAMLANNIKTLPIKKSDPHYLTLKEIAKQAYDFCQLFDLPLEAGFNLYVDIGIKLLDRKFSIYRLKSYSIKIVEHYDNKILIENDSTPDRTIAMAKAWQSAMSQFFGQDIKVEGIKEYIYFVHAKNDADHMQADYQDWINAQFEKWAFLNNAPAFSQLHGENAGLNYSLYMGKESKEFASEEEKTYFKNVKGEKKIQTKADKQKKTGRKPTV